MSRAQGYVVLKGGCETRLCSINNGLIGIKG